MAEDKKKKQPKDPIVSAYNQGVKSIAKAATKGTLVVGNEDLPTPRQGTSVAPPKYSPEPPDAASAQLLGKQYNENFGKLSSTFVEQTPYGAHKVTMDQTVNGRNAALTNAYNAVIGNWAAAAGNEYLGQFVATMGMSTPQQREATLAALHTIITGGVTAPGTQYGGRTVGVVPYSTTQSVQAGAVTLSEDLYRKVLTDPSKFDTLTQSQQQAFIKHAQEAVDWEARHGQFDSALQRTFASIASGGDLTKVMSEAKAEEVARAVKQFRAARYDVEKGGALRVNFEGAPGMFSADTSGDNTPIFTIDAKWAAEHPAQASSTAYYLQMQFPAAAIKWGENGIVGDLFDTLGKGIDMFAAPITAAVGLAEGRIRQAVDQGDVTEMKAELARQREKLRTAPLDEHADIIKTITGLEDRIAVNETGSSQGGFWDMFHHAEDPVTRNMGFADNLVHQTGLQPGDAGYEAAMAGTMLVGSFIFDPLTFAAAGLQGAKVAKDVVQVLDEAGHIVVPSEIAASGIRRLSLTRQIEAAVYRWRGMGALEFVDSELATKGFQAGIDAAKAMSEPDFIAHLSEFVPNSASRRALLDAYQSGDINRVREVTRNILEGNIAGFDMTEMLARREELVNRVNEYRDLQSAARHDTTVYRGGAGETPEEVIRAQGVTSTTTKADYAREFGGHVHTRRLRSKLTFNMDAAVSDADRERILSTLRARGIPTDDPLYIVAEEAKDGRQLEAQLGPQLALREAGVEDLTGYAALRFASETGDVGGYDKAQKAFNSLMREAGYDALKLQDKTLTAKATEYRVLTEAALDPDAARIAELKATRTDDIAEIAHMDSRLKGSIYETKPASLEDIRQLSRALGKAAKENPGGPWGLVKTLLDGRDSPGSMWQAFRRLSRFEAKANGFEGAEAVNGKLRRALFLPGMSVPGKALGAHEASRAAITDWLRVLGYDDKYIAEAMAPWDNLMLANDRAASIDWWQALYQDAVGNSKVIKNEPARADLLNLFDSTQGSMHGGDFVRTTESGQIVSNRALVGHDSIDPVTGAPRRAPGVTFSGDIMDGSDGILLPDMKTWMSAMHPLASKTVNAKAASMGSKFWKHAMLLGKMPTALPARIVMELQVRMEAMGLASVMHPIEYMKSVLAKGEYELFKEDPGDLLGSGIREITDAAQNNIAARSFGPRLTSSDPGFTTALTGRMKVMSDSPEVALALSVDTPEEFLAAVRADDAPVYLKEMADHWGDDETIKGVWGYTHAMYGYGDFAPEVRDAMLSGELDLGFANKLKSEMGKGNWYPNVEEIPGHYAVGVDPAKVPMSSDRVLSAIYNKVYAMPERNLARLPGYRQMALREYKALTRLGWDEATALQVAKETAARATSELFFKIGAHSNGEYMMRNISPFMPAWRELADTWLTKVPERLGGGHRMVGAAIMAHRGDVFLNVLKEAGVIVEAPVPGGGTQLQLVIGGKHLSFDSAFGLLPFPDLTAKTPADLIGSMAPGLGGTIGTALQIAASKAIIPHMGSLAEDAAAIIFPYGQGRNIGGQWSQFYTALALQNGWDPVAPWEKFADASWKAEQVDSAVLDAQRDLVASGGRWAMPVREKGESDKAFGERFQKWTEDLLLASQRRAGGFLMKRTLMGMVLPVALNYDSPVDADLDAAYGFIYDNNFSEDTQRGLRSVTIEAFKAAYPTAGIYLTGKTEGTFQEGTSFYDAFAKGMAEYRDPAEYMRWAYGMNSYLAYQARRDRVYAKFENNPVKYLLEGSEARDKIHNIDAAWQQWLDWNDHEAKVDGAKSFQDMFDEQNVDTYRDARMASLTTLKRQLYQLQDKLEEGDADAVLRRINESFAKLAETEYGPAKDMFGTLSKWYDKVSNPYYQKVNDLYARINATPDGPEKSALYSQLRELSAGQKPRTIAGIKFPTPEQVAFYTKTPEEQRAKVDGWLTNGHPEWLTPFQQEMSGLAGKPGPTLKLSNAINELEMQFSGTMPYDGSDRWYRARKALDAREAAVAKDLGLTDLYQTWRQPVYKQMLNAGTTGAGWESASVYADSARRSLESRGYVTDSKSMNAVADQRWLMDRLRGLYASSAGFQQTIDRLTGVLGDTDSQGNVIPVSKEDVFWQVFLGGYGSAPATIT